MTFLRTFVFAAMTAAAVSTAAPAQAGPDEDAAAAAVFAIIGGVIIGSIIANQNQRPKPHRHHSTVRRQQLPYCAGHWNVRTKPNGTQVYRCVR